MKLKEKIIIISMVTTIILTFFGCGNDTTEKKFNNPTKTYSDKRFKFSVKYPAEWESKVESTWKANEKREASPDGGITIYIGGKQNEQIYVYGQKGKINISKYGYKNEDFYTDSGVRGDLLSKDIDGEKEMHLILEDGLHGVYIRTTLECFYKNEEKIMNVLKSIKLE